MTDVRLTATNPEDSSVVPVACNSRGELLTAEPKIELIDNDVTINGALRADLPEAVWKSEGSYYGVTMDTGQPIGEIYHHDSGALSIVAGGVRSSASSWTTFLDGGNWGASMIQLNPVSGVISFHVETNKATGSGYTIPTRFTVDESGGRMINLQLMPGGIEKSGGKVIDVAAELEFLRAQVQALMEKLKMAPEGGWPVWDGSSETPES